MCGAFNSAAASAYKHCNVVFCLLHGSTHGPDGWRWLSAELKKPGQSVIAPKLPFDQQETTAQSCVLKVEEALSAEGGDGPVVVVAHSISGLVLPLLATIPRVEQLVYLSAAIPKPGMSFGEQFEQTPGMYLGDWIERGAQVASKPEVARHFPYHDCPSKLIKAVSQSRINFVAKRLWTDTLALSRHPKVSTRYIVSSLDRVFSPGWMQTEAKNTLGVTAEPLNAGRCPHLSRPIELARLLSVR